MATMQAQSAVRQEDPSLKKWGVFCRLTGNTYYMGIFSKKKQLTPLEEHLAMRVASGNVIRYQDEREAWVTKFLGTELEDNRWIMVKPDGSVNSYGGGGQGSNPMTEVGGIRDKMLAKWWGN